MLQLPTHIQLEITDLCNLRCKYCYHFNTAKMPISKDISDNRMVELVKKLVEAKVYSLVITGGEPFMCPAVTIKVLELAKKAGMFVSINTNLLLVTPSIIEQLQKFKVDSLLVSCPASNPDIYKEITQVGEYAELRLKLRLLADSNISYMVNMVVTPNNCHLLRSTAKDMFALGIKRFAATPASLNVEFPNIKELLSKQQTFTLLEDLKWCCDELGLTVDILEPMPKCFFPKWCWEKDYAFMRRSCQAGRMSVSISNTGDVRPCSHNPVIYGNLFKDKFDDIWLKMGVYRNNVTPDYCKDCPSVAHCHGGCRTNSLATSGSLETLDRFTVGHIDLPNKKDVEIKTSEETKLIFNGKLRWRKEFENYSISSKSGGANIMIINEQMFMFVRWLEKSLPLSFNSLIKTLDISNDYEDFIKVIKPLIQKEFIKLE